MEIRCFRSTGILTGILIEVAKRSVALDARGIDTSPDIVGRFLCIPIYIVQQSAQKVNRNEFREYDRFSLI